MIEDTGNMSNMRRWNLFDDAHSEIPVLTSLVTKTKSTTLPDATGSVDPQMTDKILTGKKIGIPVGFKIGIITPPTLVDFVLIAVDYISFLIGVEFDRNQVQGVLRQFIVMI